MLPRPMLGDVAQCQSLAHELQSFYSIGTGEVCPAVRSLPSRKRYLNFEPKWVLLSEANSGLPTGP